MSVPANSMPSAPVIEVRGVHTRFGSAVVHRGIDLDVGAGDILGMVGGSGSGKTTLLREIVGLLRPTEGAVRLFGHPVLDPDQAVRRSVRRRFGMLFQQGALFSAFSVFDNIAFPAARAANSRRGDDCAIWCCSNSVSSNWSRGTLA